jgi:hypothetical protein
MGDYYNYNYVLNNNSYFVLSLFNLLFRREVLSQQLNDFLIILFLGDIGVMTTSLDCAIAAKVD